MAPRNRTTFLALAAVFALLVALCGCCGLFGAGTAGGIMAVLKKSEPYAHALASARTDPDLVAAIGEPMEPGLFPSGNISVNGPTGAADLQFTLAGPGGEVDVFVSGTKDAGLWTYDVLEARRDGVVFDLR